MTEQELKALQEKLAQLEASNQELATKLKTAETTAQESQSKLNEMLKAQEQKQESEAESSGDMAKLLEIARNKISSMEADIKAREDREKEIHNKVVRAKQEEEFRKHLGAELASDVYLKLVEWDKFVLDGSNEGISFNKDGVLQAVENFKKSCPEALKTANAGAMGQAAQGAVKSNPNDSFAQRAEKLGIV